MTTVLTEKLFYFFRMYNFLYEYCQQPHFTYFGKLFKKIEIHGHLLVSLVNELTQSQTKIIVFRYWLLFMRILRLH